MIQRVVKYTTSDGKEFTDKAEATRHEQRVETEKSIFDILESGLNTGRIDAVLSVMVLHAVEVRDELNKFIRKQPKKKTQTQTRANAA